MELGADFGAAGIEALGEHTFARAVVAGSGNGIRFPDNDEAAIGELLSIVPVPWMINVLSSVFPAPALNVVAPVIVMSPAPASVPELKVRPSKVIAPAPPKVPPERVRVDAAPMTDADDTFNTPPVIVRSSSPKRDERFVVPAAAA